LGHHTNDDGIADPLHFPKIGVLYSEKFQLMTLFIGKEHLIDALHGELGNLLDSLRNPRYLDESIALAVVQWNSGGKAVPLLGNGQE